jgi:hypothetical protein
MSIFKKVTAMVCGAATVLAMGASLSASAADAVFKADQITCESGATVEYSIRLENNPGYSPSGFRLDYDERLTPVGKNGTDMEYTTGDAAAGLSPMLNHATSKARIAWSTSGANDNTKDGVIYTVKFTVPEVTEETTFPMDITVKQFANADTQDLSFTEVDGWIKVTPKVQTTTTTTTTEETTTTTTTTEEKKVDDTTTTETTTTEEGTGTETTTSAIDQPADDTTSKKGNDQPPVKTGDAGVGLAVAGLLAAAGAAVVIRRKEH